MPANIVKGRTFTSGETLTPAKLNDLVDLATIELGTIDNGDISAAAAIAHSKLASLPGGQVLVGSSTNVPTARAITGDVTFSNTGATTIAALAVTEGKIGNNAVTNAKLRQSAARSVIGNSTNASANPADITAGTDGHVLRRSGDTIGFGTIASAGIADAAVTAPKLQNGVTLQTVYAQTTAQQTVGASVSHAIPVDNTKPQNTEGLEVLTATITPSSATSKILIQAAFTGTQGNAGTITAALFKGSGADALATSWVSVASNYGMTFPFAFQDAPATTSAVTYKIRLGYAVGGGGFYLNGGSAAIYNGTMTSWMTLTEIKA